VYSHANGAAVAVALKRCFRNSRDMLNKKKEFLSSVLVFIGIQKTYTHNGKRNKVAMSCERRGWMLRVKLFAISVGQGRNF
jgi:hypothetical protein